MANSTTGKIWTADTVGIVSKDPVWVKKFVLYPNSSGDLAVLNYWNPDTTIAAGCGTIMGLSGTVTGTITSNTTLTMSSGTYLPSTIADGTVFELTEGTGSALNLKRPVLVTTAGNNTVVVSTDAAWTNEATKSYSWKTYQNYLAAKLLTAATEKQMIQMDFCHPFRFPNLILETISTSAVVYVYIA